MVVLCCTWALQQIAIKAIADTVSPFFQVALRSGVAAAIVWVLGRYVLRERWLRGVALKAGVVVGGLFATEFLLVAEGIRYSSASHVVVLLYTAPIFAAIGLHLRFPNERLSRVQWGGVSLTFAGIAVALLMEMPGARTGHALFGDFLALCGGVVWGATTVAVRISRLSEAPPTQTLFYQLLGAFVLLLPVSLATGQVHGLSGLLVWASLAFQTLIVSVVSFLIWFGLLRRYVAAPLGILCLMTPLIGVVLGSMILKERLTTPFISGTVLALTGLLVVSGSAIARRQLAASRIKS